MTKLIDLLVCVLCKRVVTASYVIKGGHVMCCKCYLRR